MTVVPFCPFIPSAFWEFLKVELPAVFSRFPGKGACPWLQECNSVE